jgi:hypothetical protein
MTRKSKNVSCEKLTEYFLKTSERLADEIIRSMRPTDSWIGTVTTGSIIPEWFETLEHVRELSEGLSYRPTPAPNSFEDSFARFDKVFPDLSSAWTTEHDRSILGKACGAR